MMMMMMMMMMGVMPRPTCGAHAFTEHRYSKSPDLCTLFNSWIKMDINNNWNFIGGFACSTRDQRTVLEPDPSGADSTHVSGCTHQLEFDAATSTTTNARIPISEGLQASCGKGKFQPDNRNGCEKDDDSDDDEWFLGFDEKMCK